MIGWLLKRWRKGQRATDLRILWPACKAQAPDLNLARVAFAFHAYDDPAWTKDFTEEEICAIISKLT